MHQDILDGKPVRVSSQAFRSLIRMMTRFSVTRVWGISLRWIIAYNWAFETPQVAGRLRHGQVCVFLIGEMLVVHLVSILSCHVLISFVHHCTDIYISNIAA
jgi:hypothetical protein